MWRRVNAAGSGLNAAQALLPEQLEGQLLAERENAQAARTLSDRMRGPERNALRRLASELDRRASELKTQYYLLTGRQLRLKTPRPTLRGTVPEELRALTLRLRQSAEACKALAAAFSSEEERFSRLERESKRQAQTVAELLRGRL